MKKIFCAVLALAAMASCSKEYIVAEDKQAIGFGEAFVDNGTRADYSTGNKEVQAFKVYGTLTGSYGNTVQIFEDADVTRPTGFTGYSEKAWLCTAEPQYWVPSATYQFAAIVDGDADDTDGLPETIPFTVADGAGNLDLLYATATARVDEYGVVTGDVSDNLGLVKFQFTHLLSKLQFAAPTHNMGNDYSVVVTDIKVTKVVDKGVYSVDGGTWAKDDVNATVNGIELDFVANDGTFETRQILPLNQTLKVTIDYDVYFGTTQISAVTKTGTIPAQDYAKNTVYVITPNIEANQIQFTVTGVTGFNTPAEDVEVDVE